MNPRHPGPSLPVLSWRSHSISFVLTLARLRCRSLLLARSFSPSPSPSFAHAHACSHARTRSLMCAVLLLAHARCVLAHAFSCCRSRAFWEAKLSYGSKRASKRLSPAHACCFRLFLSHSLTVAALSHTCAFIRSRLLVRVSLSLVHARCALTHSRALCSRSLKRAALHDMLFSTSSHSITML